MPGRVPTLASFRSKFHISHGSFRYFFKSEDTTDGTWIEITESSEPLPLLKAKVGANQDEMIVEAKVIDS